MIPDWLLTGLGCLVEVQRGTSVLELGGWGMGDLLPDQVFSHQASFSFGAEVATKYGLVITNPVDHGYSVELPCLETQAGPTIRVAQAAVEWSAKACAQGGILLAVLPDTVLMDSSPALLELEDWLKRYGTLLYKLITPGYYVLIYKHGVKMKDRVTELVSFQTGDEFAEWALDQPVFKTGVCTEDPGPLQLKHWDITVVDNAEDGRFVADPHDPDVTQLYMAKGEVRVRWAGLAPALEWAQHQALQQPPEPSWDKAVNKFRSRMRLDVFVDLVQNAPLNQILNLPGSYAVALQRPLAKHLQRFKRSRDRLTSAYPEKSTLDNRYFTLGPGARLLGPDGKPWRVLFSEPDFAHRKPPRLHVEPDV